MGSPPHCCVVVFFTYFIHGVCVCDPAALGFFINSCFKFFVDSQVYAKYLEDKGQTYVRISVEGSVIRLRGSG